MVNRSFIYRPCRALQPARRPACSSPPSNEPAPRSAPQGHSLQSREVAAVRAGSRPPRPFPPRGGRRGRREVGHPGPLPVRAGPAPRLLPPRPVRSAWEAADPQPRGRDAARRREGAEAAGSRGHARQPRPRRVPGGERVKRAGGGAAESPARRAPAADGEGAAAGGGSGRRGRRRAEEGGGPQKLLGARPAGGRASGLRAGGRTGPGLEKFARRLLSAGCGPRRPLRARCHGFPQEDEKLPSLQPGVRHPQPRGHRLLPGALRPHRADVRGERDWGGSALSCAPPGGPLQVPAVLV